MHLVRGSEPPGNEEAFVDPRAKEAWYQNLPEEYRERFREHFEADVARTATLAARERRRVTVEVLAALVVFMLFDQVCPGHGLDTLLTAAVAGAVVGWVVGLMDATRNYSAVIGMCTFLAHQVVTRGGLSVLHFFWVVPLGSAFFYLGYKREERHFV